LDILGVYPRWLGIGNLSRQNENATLNLNTVFNLGDSDKENRLGVAEGFVNFTLN